jgi:2-polyprenyl-6-methoxyphenol hydroxylase-like FAD-dependent oxidoreductase
MVFEVAIVGAGIGGPALALELLNVPGVKCTIYEMREGFEEGQHISLAPNSLRIMEHIGVLEALRAIGNSYEELHLRNAQGSILATFNNGHEAEYGYKAMRIHRRHVQRILVEQCQAKGVEIMSNMKLTTIEEPASGSKVDLVFENGQIAKADLVVGADGLHSRVRSYVSPGAKEDWARMLGVTGYLSRDKLGSSASRIQLPSHFIGQNGFIAIMPSDRSGDEIGFFSTMEFPEERSRQEWTKLFHDKDAIRKILTDTYSKDKGWCDIAQTTCLSADRETLCSWPYVPHLYNQHFQLSLTRSICLDFLLHLNCPAGFPSVAEFLSWAMPPTR